ncbi:hypothetical protein DICPUDRAFT_100077 [Dictyostelium purpureum]|uniref:Protein-serine/threonine phosphatase n=1 Tax=Dictyostelium purpureum TaxID=5786 RepID=F1A588_DICPU|nr:uncharacterized protein DICPUDRAFT_100077 [Dictyostelium purpureum]EGC28639.1 hypothetical protein DICPUDRAFT_100077 [Dictyostelium purpureum]|eukprot:XP_003294832.1 hypothetical protein DICPUDRAFT_100077 [Dictyostelium purpureum]
MVNISNNTDNSISNGDNNSTTILSDSPPSSSSFTAKRKLAGLKISVAKPTQNDGPSIESNANIYLIHQPVSQQTQQSSPPHILQPPALKQHCNNNNNNININNINNQPFHMDILSPRSSSSSCDEISDSSSSSSEPTTPSNIIPPLTTNSNNNNNNISTLAINRNFNLKLNLNNIKQDSILERLNNNSYIENSLNNNNCINSQNNFNKNININNNNNNNNNNNINNLLNQESQPLESSRWLGCDDTNFTYYDTICSKVTEYLYVGSETVASNFQTLQENGITHIINASSQCINFFEDMQLFTYKKLWLNDSPNEDISKVFEDVISFIENARKSNGKVFIHCQMGVSRSSCLCMLWIMKITRCSLEEASDLVKIIRPVSRPNVGFQLSLLNWAIKEGIQPPNSHRTSSRNNNPTNYTSEQFQVLSLSPSLIASLKNQQQQQQQQQQNHHHHVLNRNNSMPQFNLLPLQFTLSSNNNNNNNSNNSNNNVNNNK